MTYRVIYAPSFGAGMAKQVDYLRGENISGDIIESWFDRLFLLLDSLGDWPKRYPVDERMTKELRQIRRGISTLTRPRRGTPGRGLPRGAQTKRQGVAAQPRSGGRM